MGYTYYMSRKNGWHSRVHYTFKEGLKIIKDGLWALFLPVLVLGGIYGGVFTPTEAAAVSVVYALFVELFIYKELKINKLFSHMQRFGNLIRMPSLYTLLRHELYLAPHGGTDTRKACRGNHCECSE